MALIYENPSAMPAPGSDAQKAMHQEYGVITEEMVKAGVIKGGDALLPVTTATTVRVRDGKTLTTDGPFAETKETLGGYYVLDCKDLDEATRWAATIPAVRTGSIEVRPILEM